MPSRTGTASQLDGSAGNGSGSVTVPADATAVVAFWVQYDGDTSTVLSTLTLNSVPFTILSQTGSGSVAGENGAGCAILESPATGSQTCAWTWSAGGARNEGGEIVLVYVKDHNWGDAVRDAKVDSNTGTGVNASVTLTSLATDLVLGFGESFTPTNPATSGTAFISNVTVNSEIYDATEVTAGAATTVVSVTNGDYCTAIGVSLKLGVNPPPSTGDTQTRRYLIRRSRMTSW